MRVKNKKINQPGLLVQIILIVFVSYFLVMSIFRREFIPILEAVSGLTLLCMAYNSYKITKRKTMTLLYFLVGIFCLGASFFL